MGFNNDLINFLDGGTRVPYYVKDCKYYIKHTVKEDYFEHEFKIYYKNCGRYFVGIHSSQLVRKISAQDYNLVLEDKTSAIYRTELYLKSVLF